MLSSRSISTSLLQSYRTKLCPHCAVEWPYLTLGWLDLKKKLFWGEVECSLPFSQSGVLEPKDGFEDRHQLLLTRVVATPRNRMVLLRAANLTAFPVTLYKGTTIAQLFSFSKTESCSATGLIKVRTVFTRSRCPQNTAGKLVCCCCCIGIDLSTMDHHQKLAMEELVEEFADVFSVSKYNLWRFNLVYHQIKTEDHTPI